MHHNANNGTNESLRHHPTCSRLSATSQTAKDPEELKRHAYSKSQVPNYLHTAPADLTKVKHATLCYGNIHKVASSIAREKTLGAAPISVAVSPTFLTPPTTPQSQSARTCSAMSLSPQSVVHPPKAKMISSLKRRKSIFNLRWSR